MHLDKINGQLEFDVGQRTHCPKSEEDIAKCEKNIRFLGTRAKSMCTVYQNDAIRGIISAYCNCFFA